MPGPNLLLLLSDQLQRDRLSPWSGPVPMPALERLAATSLVFDRAYAACPLCVPTRPSIQTGLYPHGHGARSFGEGYQQVRPGTELLVDELAAHGYLVGYDGLWHVHRHADDQQRDAATFAWLRTDSFPYQDHSVRFAAQGGEPGRERARVTTPTDAGPKTWGFSVPRPAIWDDPIEAHPERRLARRCAESLLDVPDDQPFAITCSFAAPHPPLLPPREFWETTPETASPANAAPLGDDAPEAVRDAPGAQSVRDWTAAEWSQARRGYDAYTRFLDSNLGLVLDALDQSGRADETVVVFVADHGECLGSHGLYQKGVPYEEAAGVPLLLRAPDLSPSRCDQPVSQVDLAPTLRALLGLPARPSHGMDLLSGFERDSVGVAFDGYIQGGWHWRAIVSAQEKYARFDDGSEQLFDLCTDRLELDNLAGRPEAIDRLTAARLALAAWQAETDDDLVFPEPAT